jgi:UDP-glucose 4-epimerase
MKYFVTGGAGFIGSHLVDMLVEKGDVSVYDNFDLGKREYIKQHINKNGFKVYQADVLDFETLFKAMNGHDAVFHISASNNIAGGLEHTDLDLKQGTLATYNVLEAMKRNGIKKIVYSSSATVYGQAKVFPTTEDQTFQMPVSLYGSSKVASEALISAFCHLFDMQAWIFRFGNVSGERQTHAVLFDFINKLKNNPEELEILGDGKQKRCFFLVQDCVAGMLFGFENAKEQINVFNLGVSSMTDITTVAAILVEEMGLKNVKFKYTGGPLGFPGDVPQVSLDVEKMAKLGWRARFESTDAIRQAVKDILGEKQKKF